MALPSPLSFSVKRRKPELVLPAKPTPQELKQLSDIDDQEGFRFQVPVIMFYESNPSVKEKDPVRVIKEALAKALVYYYPLAGRLIEGPNRKLTVNCTGEGVLFIEADADVTLEQLGDTIQPPCPYFEELLYDVPGSGGILACPLLLIQVTRLICGGFVFAIRLNHTLCDGPGLFQFLNTIGEMAQGASAPSLPPVWQRELLNARDPPRVTCIHHEYEVEEGGGGGSSSSSVSMVHRSFLFSHKEIRAIGKHLPPHQRSCTAFELITACVWRCRTRALQLDPNEEVRLSCIVNGRGNHNNNLHLPPGYYGNAFAFPTALSNAELLCKNPLGYAVELVQKAKAAMSEEYIRSVADLMVIKGRPLYRISGNYIVSNTTRNGFGEVDFGWGKPLFAGPARAISIISFYVRFKNSNGVNGTLVPLCLPEPVMERFQKELETMTREPARIVSSL